MYFIIQRSLSFGEVVAARNVLFLSETGQSEIYESIMTVFTFTLEKVSEVKHLLKLFGDKYAIILFKSGTYQLV